MTTERRRSWRQAAGMGVLYRVARSPLEMSETFRHLEETQNRIAAAEHRQRSAQLVQAPGQDVTRAPTRQVFLTGRSRQEKAQDEVQRTKNRYMDHNINQKTHQKRPSLFPQNTIHTRQECAGGVPPVRKRCWLQN